MRPYIGITDFTDYSQVQRMSDVFTVCRRPLSKRMLHVGVMMSYRTLHSVPSKWSKVFPPKEHIACIFTSNRVYNCVHYADYDNFPHLHDSLAAVIEWGGDCLHGVQLDMIWPDPKEIKAGVRAARMPVEIILQIEKNAMEAAGDDPVQVVDRLRRYDGIIHRVLLDKSMGRGLGMDAARLLPFVQAIRGTFPQLGIGVAGGLGPDTMQLVRPILDAFPDVSIDAQGRLRPSGNALDPVDWDMAEHYLLRALQILS